MAKKDMDKEKQVEVKAKKEVSLLGPRESLILLLKTNRLYEEEKAQFYAKADLNELVAILDEAA